MAYIKTEWKARRGTNLDKFSKSRETPFSIILTNTPDVIDEPGTPFSAENMNHIEEGIHDAHTGLALACGDIEQINADIALMQEEAEREALAREDHSSATSAHFATAEAAASRIIMRDANGRAKIAAPSVDADIANKKYVDDKDTATNARITAVENLGQHAGTFDTKDLIPANKSFFTNGITVNDFVNVRTDETQQGRPTRYIATAIAGNGVITWTYDMPLSLDITGKADKVANAVNNNFAGLDTNGNLKDSGKKADDFATAASFDTHIGDAGNPHKVTKAQVGLGNVTNDAQVKRSEMGAASGVATLGTNGIIPASQLPTGLPAEIGDNSITAAKIADGVVPAKSLFIPANANVNSYTTPGFYHCNSDNTTATIVNRPHNSAFSLEVIRHQANGNSGVLQRWTPFNSPGIMYQRSCTNTSDSVWTAWQTFASTASPTFTGTPKVPNKTAAAGNDGTLIATEAQVHNARRIVSHGTNINPDTNASDLTMQQGSQLTGAPDSNWYSALTLRHANTQGYFSQLAFNINSDIMYYRTKISGTLSAWKKFLFEGDIIPLSRTGLVVQFNLPHYKGGFLHVYDANADGAAATMQTGGRFYIGAGESAENLRAAMIAAGDGADETEQLMLSADNAVRLFSNCQSIANRQEFIFGTDGSLSSGGVSFSLKYTWFSWPSFCIVYHNGLCIQGGVTSVNAGANSRTITFHRAMHSTDYMVQLTDLITDNDVGGVEWTGAPAGSSAAGRTTTNMRISTVTDQSRHHSWLIIGRGT